MSGFVFHTLDLLANPIILKEQGEEQLCKEIKNKRVTISNDTLIIVRFSIKVDKHPYGGISPLIFP